MTRMVPLVAVIVGCATEPTEPQKIVVVGDDVVVTADQLVAPIATHPELADADARDLVAGIQSGGYVRRILTVERADDRYTLATEDIPLGEAIGDGQTTSQLKDSKEDGATQSFALGFSVDHRALYNQNGIVIEAEHAGLTFRPVVDLEFDVSWGSLDRFLVRAGGELDGDLALAVRAPRGGTWNVAQTAWRHSTSFVQWFGWVPVVEVVELRAGMGVDVVAEGAFDVRVDAGFSTGLSAGVVYDDGGWRNLGGAHLDRHGTAPTATATGALSIHSYLFAEVSVWLYGIAGPFVSVQPQLNFRRQPDGNWTRTVGVSADGGAELVNPFGDDLSYTARLFDLQYPLQ